MKEFIAVIIGLLIGLALSAFLLGLIFGRNK